MKDDKIFLKHILDEIEYLRTYSSTLSYDQLKSDRDIEHAITRALEIIGEASKNVSLEVREKCPSVPWKDIAGMRDRINRGYFSITYGIVYDVVSRKIPEIEPIIRMLLSNFEKEI